MEFDDDPEIQKQIQWIVNIPIAIFFGFNLFLLFFIVNNKYAGEEYTINCYPQDAWVYRKGEVPNILIEATNDDQTYFFSTWSNYRFNWNFNSIKDTEDYKGNFSKNYDYQFLIDYLLGCNSIDFVIKDGFFGIEIIEKGVCN